VARDGSAGREASEAATPGGAQVIDLAELLSKSIQVANRPGPAKAAARDEHEETDEKPEKAKAAKKKRASG